MILRQLFFAIAMLITSLSWAQTNHFTIKATIIGYENKSIEIGNALLLKQEDSTLVQGEIFDSGNLLCSGIPRGNYLLKVSALGYEDSYHIIRPTPHDDFVNLGTIRLKGVFLQEIEVRAHHKLVEHYDDKLVVNVAQTALANSGTALSILNNTPKVIRNSNGQFSIMGKGQAAIYLNGQQVASNLVLQSLSSTDIQKIEIIENPSSAYDAAGYGVINIITKRRNLEGFKLDLVQEVAQAKHFRTYFKVSPYLKIKKLSLQTSYSIRPWTRGGREHYFRTFEEGGDEIVVDNKLNYERDLLTHDYYLHARYTISDTKQLSIQYDGSTSHGEKDALNKNVFKTAQQHNFELNTTIRGPYDQQNNTISLFYDQQLDTFGSFLKFNSLVSKYHLNRLEDINQSLQQNENTSYQIKQTSNLNDIEVFTFQFDGQKVLSDNTTWRFGAKNAFVANNSSIKFSELKDGFFTYNSNASTFYNYEENILATYNEFSFKLSKWKLNAGLRLEWTKSVGVNGEGEGGSAVSNNYIGFFPSTSLHKKITDQLQTKISYGRRIQRPTFQDLNPFVFYVDSLVSLRGNADLVPEYSHNFNWTFTHQKWSLDLSYTHVKDKINTIIRIENPEEASVFGFMRDNIDNTMHYAATLSFPLQKGRYSSYNMLGGRYENHHYEDQGNIISNNKAGFYIYTNQNIVLIKDIKMEVIYQYTSPRVDGIYTDNPISALSIALSRKFFGNHLTARLLANDVFDNYKFTGIATVANSNWRYLSEGDWHMIKLSLNWSFGKLGTNLPQTRKTAKNELRRIGRQ